MVTKICFKCNEEKELKNFYSHKRMADGYLNKCILCTKNDTKKRRTKLSSDATWVEKEKKRQREKYYRLEYKEKYKVCGETKKKIMSRYNEKYPEKLKAKNLSQHLSKKDGNHLHHWSYNEEHYKDVIELTKKEHYTLHRFIVYDQERMMYRRTDTLELLDSKEKHQNFLKEILCQEE